MNAMVGKILMFGVLMVVNISSAQISSTPPKTFKCAAHLNLFGSFNRGLVDNSEEIRKELLDTNTIRLIAKANQLTSEDLSTIVIAPWPDTDWTTLYQIGKSEKAFKILSEQLGLYVKGRQEGHSVAFLLTAITNRLNPSAITDPDLRKLMTNQSWLAVSMLKKEDFGSYTNRAGQVVSITTSTTIVNGKERTITTTNMPKVDEVMRWVSYTVADGDIAWRYVCRFNPDGQLDDVHETRFDAKELDSRYANLIKAVEYEVEAEMKKSGEYGTFGSCHSFWALKREKLKAKGIVWRSPSELNPNTCYD